MIRRRRLIITPGPGRQLPDPEDPSLPQVSPHQPEPRVPRPIPAVAPGTPDVPPTPDKEARGTCSGQSAWLEGLGVPADRDSRRAWLEPHLWAALRASVDASATERRARGSPSGPVSQFV